MEKMKVTDEQLKLLLRDLSMRVPFNAVVVPVSFGINNPNYDEEPILLKGVTIEPVNAKYSTITFGSYWNTSQGNQIVNRFGYLMAKPWLRKMESMTEDEKSEVMKLIDESIHDSAAHLKSGHSLSHGGLYIFLPRRVLDFFLENHFDFSNLIDEGLAIEKSKEEIDEVVKRLLSHV